MVNVDLWKRCAEALENLGGRVSLVGAEEVFEEVHRLAPEEEITFEEVARVLENNSLRLQPAPSLPIFVTDGYGHYALARKRFEKKKPSEEFEEERLKMQVVKDLNKLAKALQSPDLKLVGTEFPLDEKKVDVAATHNRVLWLLELKVDKETGHGVSQLLSYKDLAEERLKEYLSIFGAVLAPDFSDDAKIIAKDKNILLVKYRWGLYFERFDS